MSDLISRQDALDALEKSRFLGAPYIDTGILIALQEIKALPSAQPEIIRCKDCKNWIPGYITDNDDFIPPKCGKYQQMVGHYSDDYCSLAERRSE